MRLWRGAEGETLTAEPREEITMARSGIASHRAQGDVIVERLASRKLPKELSAPAKDFRDAHTAYSAAADAVASEEKKRDTALAAVATADAELDAAVESLADAMVGASLGTRKSPFKGFSTHTPSAMKGLAYADEVKAVGELVGNVRDAKPTAAVTKAADACETWAKTVTDRLKAYSLAQTRYSTALDVREGILTQWSRTLARFKKKANGVWADESHTYDAVFAPPDAVRAPVARRTKKPKKPATP
jgi:hypothetical protein